MLVAISEATSASKQYWQELQTKRSLTTEMVNRDTIAASYNVPMKYSVSPVRYWLGDMCRSATRPSSLALPTTTGQKGRQKGRVESELPLDRSRNDNK